MRKFCGYVIFIWLMLVNAVSVFGDNIIAIELTDPSDLPLSSVEVRILQDGNVVESILTNAQGRMIIPSMPQGSYEYEIDYGLCSSGSFSTEDMESGDFVWIDVDFRRVTVSLLDSNGDPLTGEEVNLYKENADGTETLCRTELSDENGSAVFILPGNENYRYTALNQQKVFYLDKNLDDPVNPVSGYSLMPIYFGFKKGGQVIDVLAQDIKVYKKNADGTETIYGMSPSQDAPDNAGHSLFDSPVSCVPGDEYIAKVSTADYDVLTVDFTAYVNAAGQDIVYFIIPSDAGGPGGPGGPGGTDPEEPEEPIILTVKTVWADNHDSVPDFMFYLANIQRITDETGTYETKINKNSFQILKYLNQTETYFITQDTTVILYLDDFILVNFGFRVDERDTTLSSVYQICINSTNGINMCTNRTTFCLPDAYCPIPVLEGDYNYSFSIRELGYSGSLFDSFEIPEILKIDRGVKDTTIYYNLVGKNKVKFIVYDAEDEVVPHILGNIYKETESGVFPSTSFDHSFHANMETDAFGSFPDYLLDGNYQIDIMDELFDFSIKSDTTIILKSSKKTKNVYFKFLLEGAEVYPQILRMDLYHPDRSPYTYISSSIQTDENGDDYRVLDIPAKCFAGEYIYEYELKDFGYNGKKSASFEAFISERKDTVIFIVLPVKPKIEIKVVDIERKPIQNVYGSIYKKNPDGTWSEDLFYDDFSHGELKTDDGGIIMDRLLPGEYLFKIDGIVQRIFTVGEYDAEFTVIAGVDYFKTTFIVMDEDDNLITNVLLEVEKEGNYYGAGLTDDAGKVELENEAGTYTYYLHYGTVKDSTYSVTQDTTIIIRVPKLIPTASIEIKGCKCLQIGESVQLFAEISPEDATFSDVNWSLNNLLYASIRSDGTLTANSVGVEGSVIVTATSKDGTNITNNILFEVQIAAVCANSQIELSIGELGVKDTIACDGTLSLTLSDMTGKVEKPVDWFLYQYSKDSINWENITEYPDPLQGTTTIDFDVQNYHADTTYFRVIAAETEEIARNVSNGNLIGACYTYGISTIATLNAINPVTSISISGCDCVRPGETIQLSAEVFPLDATCSELTWSTVTSGRVQITEDGKLTVDRNFTVGDKITVIATSTDGKSEELEIEVSNTCRLLEADFSIAEVGVKDTIFNEAKQIQLFVGDIGGETGGLTDFWYIYQSSTDLLTWQTISAATQDKQYQINTHDYRQMDTYFRVIVSATEAAVLNMAGGNSAGSCVPEGCSSIAKLRAVNIAPSDWPHIVCSSQSSEEVVLELSTEALGALYSGATVEWYKKTENDVDFVPMNIPQAEWLNPRVQITEKTIFKVKVSNAAESFENEFEKEINYIPLSDFILYADKYTVCRGEVVELSVDSRIPANSYTWFDGSTDATNTVFVDREEYWATLNDCPAYPAKVQLTVDDSIKVTLTADQTVVCNTNGAQVELYATVTEGNAGTFTWSHSGDNASSISVWQTETTTYTVEVETQLRKCPSDIQSLQIVTASYVEIGAELTVDGSSAVCQDGTQTITLIATSDDPQAKFLWWDSETPTSESQRIITPEETMDYSVQAITSECVYSDIVYSGEVKVERSTPVELSLETTVVNYGSELLLKAVAESPVSAAYRWFEIDGNGTKTQIGETTQPELFHFPSQTASYMVEIGNEICTADASFMAEVRLTDTNRIPTVFTPHDKDGKNDDFMPGYKVFIYDRYGNLICNSENGWDGTYRGKTADAGVYIYVLTMKDGRTERGTIEIIRLTK